MLNASSHVHEEFRDCGSIDTLYCVAAELFTAKLSGGQATCTFEILRPLCFRISTENWAMRIGEWHTLVGFRIFDQLEYAETSIFNRIGPLMTRDISETPFATTAVCYLFSLAVVLLII